MLDKNFDSTIQFVLKLSAAVPIPHCELFHNILVKESLVWISWLSGFFIIYFRSSYHYSSIMALAATAVNPFNYIRLFICLPYIGDVLV